MEKDIYVFIKNDNKIELKKWEKEVSPIMECGHQAQALWKIPEKLGGEEFANKTIWCCAICDGKESKIIQEIPKDFKERFYCSMGCGSFADWDKKKKTWLVNLSSKGGWNCTYDGNREVSDLPFLDIKNKKFYCGCIGWD